MNPVYVIVILACVTFGPLVVKGVVAFRDYRLRRQVLKHLREQCGDRAIWIERAYREYDGR